MRVTVYDTPPSGETFVLDPFGLRTRCRLRPPDEMVLHTPMAGGDQGAGDGSGVGVGVGEVGRQTNVFDVEQVARGSTISHSPRKF